jgi:shikimate dehydrogenase
LKICFQWFGQKNGSNYIAKHKKNKCRISLKRFGLLGRNISYSFSKGYFTDKFKDENYKEYAYKNFDIQDIAEFEDIIKTNHQELEGMNVTIPYKEL